MPVRTEELPILEALVTIRNRLTALKSSRTSYIKAADVTAIYNSVMKQVTKLNAIRDAIDPLAPSTSNNAAETEVNRLDAILNDCFQLLSLFFLTIGKNKEAPATFCQLATMKQLLNHMKESGVYTENDLKPFQSRLLELRSIIQQNNATDETDEQALVTLLLRKYDGCQRILDSLLESLSVLSPELVPIHQRLVQIRRQLAACAAKTKVVKSDASHLLEELRAIDAKRVDGKFLGMGGGSVPAGQAILAGLIEENFDISQDILAKHEDVALPLQPIVRLLSNSIHVVGI